METSHRDLRSAVLPVSMMLAMCLLGLAGTVEVRSRYRGAHFIAPEVVRRSTRMGRQDRLPLHCGLARTHRCPLCLSLAPERKIDVSRPRYKTVSLVARFRHCRIRGHRQRSTLVTVTKGTLSDQGYC